MHTHYSTLKVCTILADAGFDCGEMRWEDNDLQVILIVNDSKVIDELIVSEVSAKLWKIGYLQVRY